MKVELELLIMALIAVVVIGASLSFVSSNVDDYLHFSISKLILRDPSVLVRTTYDAPERRFITGETIPKNILSYPMLMHIMLVPFVALGAEKVFFIAMFIALLAVMWKWEKKAIPFLFLSFALTRTVVFGGIDLPVMVMAVGCIYFFEKKPMVSGIFAGLAPLIKGTGFMVLLPYLVATLIFKRKELNKKIILGMVIAILIASTWYARNLIYQDGNILAALTGNNISKVQEFLGTGVQAAQPERDLWDTTGYFPLPIDILLYGGILFTILGLIKNPKLTPEHIFIFIALGAYFLTHLIGLTFLEGLRYYIFIFPFLAVQIVRFLDEKWLKYAYVGCLIVFVFFMLSIPKYSWNDLSAQIDATKVCETTKNNIGKDYVYVKAFQDLFVIWKCKLTYQTTLENDSMRTLDLYTGNIYKTGVTQGG